MKIVMRGGKLTLQSHIDNSIDGHKNNNNHNFERFQN